MSNGALGMASTTVIDRVIGEPRKREARARGRKDTRNLLVRCGVEVFCERGFQAAGIEDILKRVGVPKGSFYHFFESKQDFGAAVINVYASYFERKLKRWFEDTTLSPLDRLRSFVADAERGMQRFDFQRGCLVGNLGQELGSFNAPFRDQLEAVLRSWQQLTASCLQLAIDDGSIAENADAGALAELFWIGWEGAILRAKLTRNNDPLEAFAASFLRLISI
jgi:TetR/AcrR family transcriptional repressor of nem operon